jgi:hypothetical protein
MKTKSSVLFAALILSQILLSCAPTTPQMVLTGSNPEIRVELLFEVDGCKVYRFYDGGTPRYFTKCNDSSSSSVGWTESCGKHCVIYSENVTNYEREAFHIPKK